MEKSNTEKALYILGAAMIMGLSTGLHLYSNRAEDNRQTAQQAYNQTPAGQLQMKIDAEREATRLREAVELVKAQTELVRAKNLDGRILLIPPNNGMPSTAYKSPAP